MYCVLICFFFIFQLKCCENSGAECCARAAGGNATTAQPGNCPCATCSEKLSDKINYGFKLTGGIGLFFSFTEVCRK